MRQHAAALTAFEHMARGLALFRSMMSGLDETLAHFAATIEADPSLGIAHAYYALLDVALHGFGLAPPEVKARARAQALLGVQLTPEESRCHGILSFLLL